MNPRASIRTYWRDAVDRIGAPAGLALGILMVAVAVLQHAVLPALGHPVDGSLQHQVFYFETAHPWRVWTIVTSMIAHSSVLHLLLAGQLVVVFSTYVEPQTGSVGLIGIFLVTALAALAAGYVLDAAIGASSALIGSSGAGFGLLGWLAGNDPRMRLQTIPPGPAWGIAGGLLVLSVGVMLAVGVDAFGIAHIGHVAGLLAGAALGFAMR